MRVAKRWPIARALATAVVLCVSLDLTQACERPLDGTACACVDGNCSCLSGFSCCADRTCRKSCDPEYLPAACEPAGTDGRSGKWCWVSPHPHGRLLFDVWGPARNEIWAGGEGGTLIHWDGESWKARPSPTESTIAQVWGLSADDFWLVTDRALFRRQGGVWSKEPRQFNSLRSLWAAAPRDLWAVTEHTVLRKLGDDWDELARFDDVYFGKVWGTDSDHVWAVGSQIFVWDGHSWSEVPKNSVCAENVFWNEIRGTASDDVWVASNGAKCTLHWDGSTWSAVSEPKLRRLFEIHDSSDVGATDDQDRIIRWDGSKWRPVISLNDTAQSVKAVWANDDDEIWSVGDGIRIKRWHNGVANDVAPFTGATWSDLNHLHGLPDREMWVVGNSGLILHYDGRNFVQEDPNISQNLKGVWAQATNDVWAVGDQGAILHRGDDGWRLSANLKVPLAAVWASGIADAWAVGTHGAVHHFDGVDWSPVPSPTEYDLMGVWGSGNKDLWVVGGYLEDETADDNRSDKQSTREVAELIHWNGVGWDKRFSPRISASDAGLDLYGWTFCTTVDRFSPPFGAVDIWGKSSSSIWVTTRCGGPLFWDGEDWRHVPIAGNDRDLRGVWGNSSGEVWIVGNWGRIDHRRDGNWLNASITGSSTPRLNAIWGASSGELWAVGADGSILRNVTARELESVDTPAH